MIENPFALSHHAGDLVGVILILVIAVGVSCLMWIDYRKYLDEHTKKQFRFLDFIKREQLFLFLFLMFFFLIVGQLILYSNMI